MSTNPDTPDFNPGGFPDRYDSRDFQLAEVAGGVAAPFDWSVGFDIENQLRALLNNPSFKIPVKDQNGSYSCGGQAWSYLAEVLEALNTGSFEERSAKFIYAQTYVPGGGSRGRDNGDIYTKQGAARESILTSYENGIAPKEPFMEKSEDITDSVRLDAKADLSSAYAQTGVDIDAVATAIKNFSGVILGISGSNNGTWSSAFPKPPSGNQTVWGHWVYAGKTKLVNGIKHVGIINSWGAGVGEQGWQWLSEDYFLKAVWSGWTHIFNPNPPPPSFTHTFAVNILFGQTGSEVVALQTALQLHGDFPMTVPTTGFYGDITRRAVLSFRLKQGVSSSTDPLGKSVGPLTREALNKLYGS